MLLSMRHLIFLLLFTTGGAEINREDYGVPNVFSVVNNGRLDSHAVLMFLEEISLDKCVNYCIMHLQCFTVSYSSSARLCELNDMEFDEDEMDPHSDGWRNFGTPAKVSGGWGRWTNDTGCTKTCGRGVITYHRKCDNPTPQHGGGECTGDKVKTEICNDHKCPISGGWGRWTNDTGCTKTCGGGVITYHRKCDNPTPQHGGDECAGDEVKTETCNNHKCPIAGGWGRWTNDTDCTKTCGGGVITYHRKCDNPTPQHGGDECTGDKVKTEICNNHKCPICYGTKDDTYGEITAPKSGKVKTIKLIHKSGSVSCQPSDISYWGCDGYSHNKFLIFITDANKNILFPDNSIITFNGDYRYFLGGKDINDTELSLKISTPINVEKGETLRLWDGQDLADYAEQNNGGEHCVDVEFIYE